LSLLLRERETTGYEPFERESERERGCSPCRSCSPKELQLPRPSERQQVTSPSSEIESEIGCSPSRSCGECEGWWLAGGLGLILARTAGYEPFESGGRDRQDPGEWWQGEANGSNAKPMAPTCAESSEQGQAGRGRGRQGGRVAFLAPALPEIGILLPNNQRQHRTLHIQKDVLPYALC